MTRSTDRPVPSLSSERSPVALAEARGRSRPQRSFLRRFSLHCLSPLMLVVNTADAGIFTYGGLVGTSDHATAVTGLSTGTFYSSSASYRLTCCVSSG